MTFLCVSERTLSVSESVQASSALLMICVCVSGSLCPTLCDPMDCSLPDSAVHGILQARILEWVAITFSRPYDIIISEFIIFLIYQ